MTITTEERLSRLEKSNQKLKTGIMALAVTASGALILGAAAPPPRVVTAEKFVLVDPSGHERAELSANSKAAALQFLNANGTRGLLIASGTSGNAITLADANGQDRELLVVDASGEATLAFTRKDLPQETFILSDSTRGTSIAIRDLAGKDRINFGFTSNGAGLSVADGNGTPRTVMSDTTLAAFDKGGLMYWGSFADDITPEGRKRIMDTVNLMQKQK